MWCWGNMAMVFIANRKPAHLWGSTSIALIATALDCNPARVAFYFHLLVPEVKLLPLLLPVLQFK